MGLEVPMDGGKAGASDGDGPQGVSHVGTRWSRRVAADLIGFADVLAIAGGGAIATLVQFTLDQLATDQLAPAIQLSLLSAAVAHFILLQLGDYRSDRITVLPAGPGRIGLVLFSAFSCVFSVALTLGLGSQFPASWLPIAVGASIGLVAIVRFIARSILAHGADRGLFDTSLAVYGTGRIALKLYEHVRSDPGGLRLVGIYDDRQDQQRMESRELPVAGSLRDLIEAGRAGSIDEIVIALPQSAERRISDIVRKLEQLPVRIRICTHISSDLVDALPSRHRVSNIGPLGLLDVKSKPLKDWAPVLKRIVDLGIATIALVVASPLMLAVAVAIRLDSPGAVFFRQQRHGLNHREFDVLKFRSMTVAESGAAVRQATRGDARVTRIGRFIRRTSLDELPQLINVLKGDMSLVGPRPHALVHNEYYGEMLERYANRHQVKPGITGWAQVNGFRGETRTPQEMQARVEHDLYYIDNWSLWLDLRILALTPMHGMAHQNAY